MHLKHKMAMAVAVSLAAMAASPVANAAPHAQARSGQTVRQALQAPPTSSGTCDPFADWDWDYYEDGDGNDSTSHLRASGHASVPAPGMGGDAARVIGTTPEAIERGFLRIVTQNLASSGTAGRVARLGDRELAAIARHAAQGAPAERAGLLKLFAMRLDGAALVRVARAFGRAPVEAAVRAYADPATRVAFAADAAGLMAPPPEGGDGNPYPSPSPPRPTIDMTLEEIYLEFRTAPIGSLSPSASLAETAMFAGKYLSAAFGAGLTVGSGISWLIQNYAPGLDNAIGATVATMIDNFWEATNEVQQGHYEAAFDQLFGFQVTWSSDPFGDWDISTPMVEYYEASGSCGY